MISLCNQDRLHIVCEIHSESEIYMKRPASEASTQSLQNALRPAGCKVIS